MWTKLGAAAPATRSLLSTTYSWAPLKRGLRIENSFVETYTLWASMPSSGWSPKHGQAVPPGWVTLILNVRQGPRGSGDLRTAISTRPAVNVSFRKAITANQVPVAGS